MKKNKPELKPFKNLLERDMGWFNSEWYGCDMANKSLEKFNKQSSLINKYVDKEQAKYLIQPHHPGYTEWK